MKGLVTELALGRLLDKTSNHAEFPKRFNVNKSVLTKFKIVRV